MARPARPAESSLPPLILLVGLSDYLRSIASDSFASGGCRTHVAGDADNGLAAARQAAPLAILTQDDAVDARQLLRAIRANRRTAGIPVFVITRDDDGQAVSDWLRDGATEVWIEGAFGMSGACDRVRRALARPRGKRRKAADTLKSD